MGNADWDRYADRTFELWDHLLWAVAQWICQQRAVKSDGEGDHIRNPAASNYPCDPCYDEAFRVVNDGLCPVLQAFGAMAYSCGRAGLQGCEAASRALGAMIERVREIEATKELLAQVAGEDGWWGLPFERDERRELLGEDDDTPNA